MNSEIDPMNMYTFNEIADINPPRTVKKGTVTKYLSMDSVEPRHKHVSKIEYRKYNGGSKFKKNDILFARITPSLEHGKTCIVDFLEEGEIGAGSTEFIVISSKDDLTIPEYLYYLTTSNLVREPAIKSMTGTSGRQRVDTSVFDSIIVPIPPLLEQVAIAKILSDLDSKIELNQKMNKILEAIAQAIFKHWFIDFEFPNENGKPYKSSGGEMVDSELREIPKGWEVKRLGDVVNIVRGVSYKSSELIPSENALVTLKSILRGGGFTKNGFKPYSGDYKESQLVNAQDIIIAFTDLTQQGEVVGRPAMVEDTVEYKNMIASMDVGVIRFKENFQFKFFIYQLLKSESFHSHLLGYVNGTTVLHLSNEGPKSYMFSCPDTEHLIQFENLLLFFYSRIHYNSKQIEFLSLARDLLLPKLISGKIRVPLEE